MDIILRDHFLIQWNKYFGIAELPIIFYYSEETGGALEMSKPKGRSCLICDLARVRNGESIFFNSETIGCMGGKRFTGYISEMRPTFRYFISCGLEGVERGERYKISPEVVDEFIKSHKHLAAGKKNIIFKRWDNLTESDNPEVVIFFAQGEVLSGLFTLANFDTVDPNYGVVAPFSAGCGSIVYYPSLEKESKNPRCILGMFDPSARPCVPENMLSFAVPYERFVQLAGYMDESFLITPTWEKVKKRINKVR
jgi:uncharacterized protein (DUF169 family)